MDVRNVAAIGEILEPLTGKELDEEDDESRRVLESLVSELRSATCVDIHDNDGMCDLAMSTLGRALQRGPFSRLEELRLAYNEIGTEAFLTLVSAVETEQLQGLRVLDIEGNKIGGYGIERLVGALESGKAPSLDTLFTRFNPVGVQGVTALANALASERFPSLKRLSLSICQYGAQLSKEETIRGARAVGKALKSGHLRLLETLRVNYFGDAGIVIVMRALRSGKVSGLKELDLVWNDLGVDGATSFAQAMESSQLSSLSTIDVGFNPNFGDEGTCILAASFAESHMEELEYLHLDATSLGSRGAIGIAHAMQAGHLPKLKCLSFSANEIGVEGAQALGQAFQSPNLSSLEELTLYDNNTLGDEGIIALTKGLKSRHMAGLKRLDVRGTSMEERGVWELARVLEDGYLPVLKCLTFGAPYSETTEKSSHTWAEAFINSFHKNPRRVTDIQTDWPSESVGAKIRALRGQNLRSVRTLKSLEEEEGVPATHGKLFLCGHPNVGKTTLRKTLGRSKVQALLSSERKAKPVVEKRTRGIEVSHIVNKRDQAPLRLAVWDLAGQDEYHLLHSAFLPDLAFAEGQATLFVVVCSANYTQTSDQASAEEELLYWLKFIASSSVKGVEELKRNVFVVLNCFKGLTAVYNVEEWRSLLSDYNTKFRDFLKIHTDPFIMDVRVSRQVKVLKKYLMGVTSSLLKDRKMPKICELVQNNLEAWKEEDSNFPVVSWNEFANRLLNGVFAEEKLRAATEYLHGSGHLIFFREGSLKEGGLPGHSVVIFDPEWFCQKVVGQMLLPEGMLERSEIPLKRRMQPDGSILITELQRYFHHLLATTYHAQVLVAVLLRLGLCYKVSDERVLIPALIDRDHIPSWCYERVQDQWVMGFALRLRDSETTLLPISLFRKFQVGLAQDPAISGRTDGEFGVGKFHVRFKMMGMLVLVEFVADDKKSSIPHRVDILAKPLVDGFHDSMPARRRREEQVNLSQAILERLVSISAAACPGVEFLKQVVKPWPAAKGLLPMLERDAETSVEDVKKWVQEHGMGTDMNWKVGDELVKEEELLSRAELHELQVQAEQKLALISKTAVDLGLLPENSTLSSDSSSQLLASDSLPPPSPESAEGEAVSADLERQFPARTESQRRFSTLIHEVREASAHLEKRMEEERQHFDERLEESRKHIDKRMDELMSTMEEVRDSLHEALKGQKLIMHKIQSLHTFSISEKQSSVPRFVYISHSDDQSKWTVRIKDAIREKSKLHLLCEARYNDRSLHEVIGQVGLDIRRWVKDLGPWLEWSLKVSFMACKVAGVAALPGLGFLMSDESAKGGVSGPNLSGFFQYIPESAKILGKVLDKMKGNMEEYGRKEALDIEFHSASEESAVGSRSVGPPSASALELKDAAKGTLKELLGDLSHMVFLEKFGLRRVLLMDSRGSGDTVCWICKPCFQKYGKFAVEI